MSSRIHLIKLSLMVSAASLLVACGSATLKEQKNLTADKNQAVVVEQPKAAEATTLFKVSVTDQVSKKNNTVDLSAIYRPITPPVVTRRFNNQQDKAELFTAKTEVKKPEVVPQTVAPEPQLKRFKQAEYSVLKNHKDKLLYILQHSDIQLNGQLITKSGDKLPERVALIWQQHTNDSYRAEFSWYQADKLIKNLLVREAGSIAYYLEKDLNAAVKERSKSQANLYSLLPITKKDYNSLDSNSEMFNFSNKLLGFPVPLDELLSLIFAVPFSDQLYYNYEGLLEKQEFTYVNQDYQVNYYDYYQSGEVAFPTRVEIGSGTSGIIINIKNIKID